MYSARMAKRVHNPYRYGKESFPSKAKAARFFSELRVGYPRLFLRSAAKNLHDGFLWQFLANILNRQSHKFACALLMRLGFALLNQTNSQLIIGFLP